MTTTVAASGILGAGLGILLILLAVALGIALMAFWIWMLISAIKNKSLRDGERVGWVLAIVFFHFIGSLLYFFIAHPRRHSAVAGAI